MRLHTLQKFDQSDVKTNRQHIPYTPDHDHDHDYDDHVDDYDVFDDGDDGNGRDIIPDRLSIEGLQHTCWLILGRCNYDEDDNIVMMRMIQKTKVSEQKNTDSFLS